MKPALLVTLGLFVAATTVAFASMRSPAPVRIDAPPSLATVALGKSSEDGKAVFNLRISEPWSGAGHRVIALRGASVTASGLASLALEDGRADFATGSEALSVVGEKYTCTAHLNVPTWSDVHREHDVTLEISVNH